MGWTAWLYGQQTVEYSTGQDNSAWDKDRLVSLFYIFYIPFCLKASSLHRCEARQAGPNMDEKS